MRPRCVGKWDPPPPPTIAPTRPTIRAARGRARAGLRAVGIMAFFAVLIASINVGGGFRVTHRMLKMFRK